MSPSTSSRPPRGHHPRVRPLRAAEALGQAERGDRRRHPHGAAREQPARRAAHPLWPLTAASPTITSRRPTSRCSATSSPAGSGRRSTSSTGCLAESEFEPDTVHADTQGQSEPVFGLAYLLGIELLPRMRTWNDAELLPAGRRIEVQAHRRAVHQDRRLAASSRRTGRT